MYHENVKGAKIEMSCIDYVFIVSLINKSCIQRSLWYATKIILFIN